MPRRRLLHGSSYFFKQSGAREATEPSSSQSQSEKTGTADARQNLHDYTAIQFPIFLNTISCYFTKIISLWVSRTALQAERQEHETVNMFTSAKMKPAKSRGKKRVNELKQRVKRRKVWPFN